MRMEEKGQVTGKKKVIVATKNRGKLEEIAQLLSGLPYEVFSMTDAGVDGDIAENGSTFAENALIKARTVWNVTGETVMADDSGLEVDHLNGAPGILSARYAGENAKDEDKYRKLLKELSGVPADQRSARFVCAIALILPDGREIVVRGTCEGYIAKEPAGTGGFGYDPVFYVPGFGMTFAQMDEELKNSISHRGNALRKVLDILAEEAKKH
jgi:XTP/dITP diphosphohydrolase